ncbi:MAG: aminopeptidase P family protein [Acholeplasmataceae bacterium]|nr:aminopeptidase P family protein [Acholeplasmataceae bacterium]
MFKERRLAYLENLAPRTLSLFFSGKAPQKSSDQHYLFSVNRNFFYLTGIDQQNVCLLLAKGENESKAYLFIEPVDPVKALWDGAGYTFGEASDASEIDLIDIKDIATLDTFIASLLSTSRRALFGFIETIYLDLERLNEHTADTKAITYSSYLKNLYPHVLLKTNQMMLAELRTVKDDFEITQVKKALTITKEGLNQIMSHMAPGKFEFQLQAEFNYVLNMHKTSPSFDTIAAGGKNATTLHYIENDSKINDGDLVLFDLGVEYGHYCSDITRVYPASGKFNPRQKEVYEVVLNVNKKAIEFLKPGITLKDYNEYGKKLLTEGAKKLGLIREDDEINKYYYHSLGHYLGLDVHDVGNYTKPIPEGALITVEPGLYIAEEGIGIRIEDDIIVSKHGNINLSKDIIKEVHDIEEFMKK